MSFPPVDTFVVGGDLYEIMMRDYTIVYNIQILVSPAAMDLNLCFEKLWLTFGGKELPQTDLSVELIAVAQRSVFESLQGSHGSLKSLKVLKLKKPKLGP